MSDLYNSLPSPRFDLSNTFDQGCAPVEFGASSGSAGFAATYAPFAGLPDPDSVFTNMHAYPSSEDEMHGSSGGSMGPSDFSSAFNSPFQDEAHIPMQLDAVVGAPLFGHSAMKYEPMSPRAPISAVPMAAIPAPAAADASPASPQMDMQSSHDDSSDDSGADAKSPPPAEDNAGRKRTRKAKVVVPEMDSDDDDDDGSMDHLSKRERNKRSAAKYRKRRKVYLNSLEGKVEQMEKNLANKSSEVTALKQKNQSLATKISALEEQLAFFKNLLGSAGQAIPTPPSRSRGAVMFVLFAAFLLALPFSTLTVSTVSDPFDHSVSGHRGRIILSLPETDWWETLSSHVIAFSSMIFPGSAMKGNDSLPCVCEASDAMCLRPVPLFASA